MDQHGPHFLVFGNELFCLILAAGLSSLKPLYHPPII